MNLEQNTFTLALELLYGCQHSCSGCLANKGTKRIPTAEEFEFLYELMAGIGERYRLQEIELAPTDFLSSANLDEVVNNAGLQKLFTLFDNVEINTTLLAARREDYQRMADAVNMLKSDGGLGLIVPFEIKHIANEKYLDTFRLHLRWLEEAMGRPLPDFEISFSVGFDSLLSFNYRSSGQTEKLYELYDRFMRTSIHEHASFHFNPSNRRDFLSSRHDVQDVKKTMETLNRMYELDLQRHPSGWREDAKTYRMHVNPLMKRSNYAGSEVFWSDGKLYHVPALYKNIELEDPAFEFKGTTVQDYWADVERLTMDALFSTDSMPDCQSCPHILECSQKHTQLLAERMGIGSCVFKSTIQWS